jgi:hypothetical protein
MWVTYFSVARERYPYIHLFYNGSLTIFYHLNVDISYQRLSTEKALYGAC